MTLTVRMASVAAAGFCALAVLAFVGARLEVHGYRYARELWMGVGLPGFYVALAAGLVWGLRPVFLKPDGLRVPPLALTIAAILLLTTPIIFAGQFMLYVNFGGSK